MAVAVAVAVAVAAAIVPVATAVAAVVILPMGPYPLVYRYQTAFDPLLFPMKVMDTAITAIAILIIIAAAAAAAAVAAVAAVAAAITTAKAAAVVVTALTTTTTVVVPSVLVTIQVAVISNQLSPMPWKQNVRTLLPSLGLPISHSRTFTHSNAFLIFH